MFRGKRLHPWAPYVALFVIITLVVGAAVFGEAVPVRVMDLNNSGVWVSNNQRGLFGRVNRSAGALDAALADPNRDPGQVRIDIFQDQESVIGWTRSQSRLFAIDTRGASATASPVMVSSLGGVAMGGGVVAVISDQGELRTTSYSPNTIPDLTSLAPDAAVVAKLEVLPGLTNGVSVAVDGAGRVYAASATGATVMIDHLGALTYDHLGQSLASVSVSLVNGLGVVVDRTSGDVFLSNGQRAQFGPDSQVAPQQPSTTGDRVVVATTMGLQAVPLDGGDPVALFARTANHSAVPAQPVVLGAVTYGAWGGTPGEVVRLTPADTQQSQFPVDGSLLAEPVFRVNRGSVVLNDLANGVVFDIDDQQPVDDWDAVDRRGQADDGESRPDNQSVPQAQPDYLWARPGRVAVLHVLDNDSNPGAGLLAITELAGPDADRVVISPNGQTLVATVPDGQIGDLAVTYTITNQAAGQSGTKDTASSANVVIAMRAASDNTGPNLFGALGRDPATPDYSVVSGGWLKIAPTPAWRDPDSDPVLVLSAKVGERTLPVTAEGLILYSAPVVTGQLAEAVHYQVSDGSGLVADGVVHVAVMPADGPGVAPKAMSDVVRAVVGQPVTVYPLGNDLPGCDPMNRAAELKLAAPVVGTPEITVATDLVLGAVTMTASQPGAYFLDYSVSFGSLFASGKIRVDVVPADHLVAMPDAVVVHGTVPVLVDVLANDHDGLGSMLSVVSATGDERVQVAVVQGRWLRIGMVSSVIVPSPTLVEYRVSNGRGDQAIGQVAVSQAPAVDVDRAYVVDDYARVRVGDVTAIRVLANDASASGAPLVINDNVPGMAAGQLPVVDPSAPNGLAEDLGQAFVDGGRVRYLAPTSGDARRLRIEYQAGVAAGSPVTGYIWVDVLPETHDETVVNHPPAPELVEVRAMVGDTVTVPVEIYGQDPDGDSVIVAGLAIPAKFGRVTAIGANSLTYESYPDAIGAGSDVFQYYVQDRYGAVGIGTVRVGLLPPGTPAPPLAVDDLVTAQPGSPVTVYPLANDILPIGASQATVELDSQLPDVELDPTGLSVLARSPAADSPAVSFTYHVVAGAQAGVSAQVSLRSQVGYLNPPKVYDHVADQIADGVASVDVLDDAWDVDGATSQIRILSVGAPGSFSDGVVSVPLSDRGQVVPFVVEDGDGAQSMAVVFVPSLTAGRPTLISGGLITMDQNSTKQVMLNDYISSPRGSAVHLTMASRSWASPQADLALAVDSDTQITLTSGNDYIGPAALTVEVRDAPDATDPQALTGVVTIPVQIGPVVPVLWCPATPQQVVQGGVPRPLDIAHLCHVWAPMAGGAQALSFTGSWAAGGEAVTISGRNGTLPSDWLMIQAGSSATPGAQSMLEVQVAGYEQVTGQIPVQVIAAPRPQLAVSSVTDVQQGTTVAVPVTVTSPMLDPAQHIVAVVQTAGSAAAVRFDDRVIQVTPTGHGVATFDVTASDMTDDSRTDRQVTASFSVTVYGVPDAPSPPQQGTQLRSQSAVVAFSPGADNGSPITEYELRWDGGSQSCGLSTTCEVPNLVNGMAYRFQVRAANKAGWSPWSDLGAVVVPDALPGTVTRFSATAPGCGSLELSWNQAVGQGSAVTGYRLSWPGLTTPITLPGEATTYTPMGLDNNMVYTFSIIAVNQAGSGQPTTVQGQSSCQPLWPGGAVVNVASQDMGGTAQVVVNWTPADPQGPTPVTYQVTRSGPDGTKTFAPTTTNSLGDTGIVTNGAAYTYTVVATNASGGTGHTSGPLSTQWTAVGVPDAWTTVGGASAVSASATGNDGELLVEVRQFPDFHDTSGTVIVRAGDKVVATLSSDQPSQRINGFTNGQSVDFTFTACNSVGACNVPQAITSNGSIGQPTASLVLRNGVGTEVCFTATVDGAGRPEVHLVISMARLAPNVTADSKVVASTPSSSGQETIDMCVDPGYWDILVDFTVLLYVQTSDPRIQPMRFNQGIRTPPAGIPDEFASGDLTLEPTGIDGELRLTVNNKPASNGNSLTVYYLVPGGSDTSISNTDVLTNLPDGQPASVRVWASNGSNSNTGTTLTATPYGPLSKPSLMALPGSGTKVCVRATTPDNGTNGAPASLVLTADGTEKWKSSLTTGAIDSGEQCVDTGGYNQTVQFAAGLVTQTGLKRTDSESTSLPVTSPASPPETTNPTSPTPTTTSQNPSTAPTNIPRQPSVAITSVFASTNPANGLQACFQATLDPAGTKVVDDFLITNVGSGQAVGSGGGSVFDTPQGGLTVCGSATPGGVYSMRAQLHATPGFEVVAGPVGTLFTMPVTSAPSSTVIQTTTAPSSSAPTTSAPQPSNPPTTQPAAPTSAPQTSNPPTTQPAAPTSAPQSSNPPSVQTAAPS